MSTNAITKPGFLQKLQDQNSDPLTAIQEKQQKEFNPYKSVERLMNLGSDRSFILDGLANTDNEDYSTYLKIITKLLKKGIVGYEYLEVNNRPYKSFITTSIGDQKLAGAKTYNKKNHTIYA